MAELIYKWECPNCHHFSTNMIPIECKLGGKDLDKFLLTCSHCSHVNGFPVGKIEKILREEEQRNKETKE